MSEIGPELAELLDRLPGEEIVRDGLADLNAGRESIHGLLLEIAAGRLRSAGVRVPPFKFGVEDPEFRLLRLLGETHGHEAHSQYNAWLRLLGSLCQGLERRLSQRAAKVEQGHTRR